MINFKNILIAEDDKEDYLFLEEGLKEVFPDFTIRRADNGLQLMGYLKSFEKPDIIFLDLNMPVTNGMESLQLIRAIPEFQHIPIIMYSTSHNMKEMEKAYAHGAHYYIVKPTKMKTLVNVLLTLFSRLTESVERPSEPTFVLAASGDDEEEKRYNMN